MVKILNAVIKAVGQILRVLLIFTVGLVCLQIVCRYLVGKPLTWTEQLARYAFIWMMMLGIPVLFYNKNFMAFDLILNVMPEKIRKFVRVFIDLAICLFAVFWLVGAVKLCIGTANKMTSGVRIHYYWLYSAQAVSSLLIIWVMLTQAVQNIICIVTGKPLFEEIEEKKGGE